MKGNLNNCQKWRIIILLNTASKTLTMIPVSYTHLDVYKRQAVVIIIKWKRKHYITEICLPATNDIFSLIHDLH